MPNSRSPSTMYGSTGLIRGQPSFRRVPTRARPARSKRSRPAAASSGAASANSCQFMLLTSRRLVGPHSRVQDSRDTPPPPPFRPGVLWGRYLGIVGDGREETRRTLVREVLEVDVGVLILLVLL